MITIELLTQLRAAAGQDALQISCEGGTTVSALLSDVADAVPSIRDLLLDGDGVRHGWLMISIDDALVARGSDPPVQCGCTVVLVSPVAGG